MLPEDALLLLHLHPYAASNFLQQLPIFKLEMEGLPRVVIVGGGIGGVEVALNLAKSHLDVTLIGIIFPT